MPTTKTAAQDQQSDVDLMTYLQEQILVANESAAKRVGEVISSLRNYELPTDDSDVAERSLAYVRQISDAGKAFSEKLRSAWTPVTEAFSTSDQAPAAKK